MIIKVCNSLRMIITGRLSQAWGSSPPLPIQDRRHTTVYMAEANRDEALRCYELSQRFHVQREYELAFKYAEKSIKLFETAEAVRWLETVQTSLSQVPPTNKESPIQEKTTATTTEKEATAPKKSSASFTKEQAEEVKKFLRINRDDFYAVLGVSRTSDEAEIRKAYRKLALRFHPDKNHAPGADEAFKIVSRAFSCLNDNSKKQQYDQFGTEDPSAGIRFRRNATTTGSRFNFEGDISPEELFNMFFNDSVQFRSHGFGPVFVSTFNGGGGGGVYSRRRRHPPQPEPPLSWIAVVIQLIPVALIALIMFMSNLVSQSHATNPTWEAISSHISFIPSNTHSHPFTTHNRRISYWTTLEYRNHVNSNGHGRKLRVFEEEIERRFVTDLQKKCKEEQMDLQSRKAKAAGDPDKLKVLQQEKLSSCERLHSLGSP